MGHNITSRVPLWRLTQDASRQNSSDQPTELNGQARGEGSDICSGKIMLRPWGHARGGRTEYRFDEFARANREQRRKPERWREYGDEVRQAVQRDRQRLPKHPSATVFSDRLALQ